MGVLFKHSRVAAIVLSLGKSSAVKARVFLKKQGEKFTTCMRISAVFNMYQNLCFAKTRRQNPLLA